MARRITIKDLAGELNLHHSTISRALHDSPVVKPETKAIVLDVAKKLGYQINLNALHLRGNSKNAIALIVPNIRHSFFTNIVSQISNLAHQEGYVISMFESSESFEREQEIINMIIQYNFAGVIASIAQNTVNSEHFQVLRRFNIPLVFFDRVCNDIQTAKVLVNNYESTFNATEMMIDRGYRKIAHVTGPLHLNVFFDRMQGYIAALSKRKMSYQNYIIINRDFSIEDGKVALLQLLDETEKSDAILSSSGVLSIGISLKAKELGLRIPNDLALMSFGDNQISDILEPGITSIVQPEVEIANACFEFIMGLIKNEFDIDSPLVKNVKTIIKHRQSI